MEAGSPGDFSSLQPVLTRPIDWDLIARQYDEMMKYATALRLWMPLRAGKVMVNQGVPSWNQLVECLRGLEALREVGQDAPWNTSEASRESRQYSQGG